VAAAAPFVRVAACQLSAKGQIAELRAYVRQRERLLEYAASHIQHMQKALTEMNLQLHHVVADITGSTGLRIIRAILAGERDPEVLACAPLQLPLQC
jgi:alkylation response protein AidB-like acyl-CoA dehydrogenase